MMFPSTRALAGRLTALSRRAAVSRAPNASTTLCIRPFSTMELIKDLRSTSGAPIVDCKKALAHSDNDLKLALDWLREHGSAKVSSKVGDRAALEGLVGVEVADDHKSASIVQVASETDFAGRSETFVDLVMECAAKALKSSNDGPLVVEDLGVEPSIQKAIVAIRENISLAQATRMEAADGGVVVGYVHGRVLPSYAGTAAALVELTGVEESELLDIGKKLSMHIVAAKPQYLDIASVPQEVVDAERDILAKQIAEQDSNKPPEIVTKIVEGRLRKFYETICLTEQSHMIEEGNPKIGKHLKSLGVQLNRYSLSSVGGH